MPASEMRAGFLIVRPGYGKSRLTIGFFALYSGSVFIRDHGVLSLPRKSAQTPAIPRLGDLEVAVLKYVWTSADVAAKDAHAAVGLKRGISLNTVQSTLERLFRKKLLTRVKAGHSFRYSACMAREQLVASLINDVLRRFSSDSAAALAAFVEAADSFDDSALLELEVEPRKRRQRGKLS